MFDITIYLSPGDMWTAEVAADADGFSRLVTNDNSSHLPSAADIKDANNGRFKTNRVLAGDKAQTREGYIEILNTADIPPTFQRQRAGIPRPTPVHSHQAWTAPPARPLHAVWICKRPTVIIDATACPNNYVPWLPKPPVACWPTGR
ncbi:MAG: hypothetical protein U1E74_05755 [Paenacidovorax caeni]